jgi:HemY protein
MKLTGTLRFLLWSLLVLAGAVLLGAIAGRYPGHLLLMLGEWRIEMSAALFVALLVATCATLYGLLRLLAALWRMPRQVSEWREQRVRLRADQYLQHGLLALLEGNWHDAEILLARGAPLSRAPLIHYLGAARAAQQQGELERRDHYLRLAHQASPQQDIVIGIVQAELQLNRRQTEQALATLKHLHDRDPGRRHVQELLLQTYSRLGEWEAMLGLLPKLAKTGGLTPGKTRAREIEAYRGLLREPGRAANRAALDRLWLRVPRRLRVEPELIEIYVARCLALNDAQGCEQLLRRALGRGWSPALARLYGQVNSEDTAAQLAFAENLLKERPRDETLLLTAGRLCARSGLWGKARAYFETSIEVHPSPEAHRELADLLRQQGEHSAASRHYQQGLILATGGARSGESRELEDQRVDAESAARQVV